MKKQLLLILIFVSLVNLLGCQMTAPAASEKIDGVAMLSVAKSSRKIPPYFFGIHTNIMPFMVGRVKGWKNIATLDTQLVKEIKFQSLRGPCGGPGNNYLWKEGEILNPTDPRYAKYYGKKSRYGYHRKHSIKEGYPPLMLKDIYQTAQATNLPYCFQLNVISQDHKTIVAEVKRISELTKQPIFLELGSELYNGSYALAIPDPIGHATEMAQLTRAIKKAVPNAKVAIDSPSPALQRRALIFKNRGQGDAPDWDGSPAGRILLFAKTVTDNIQNFDATLIHTYTPIATMDGQTPISMMRYFFAFNELEQQACKKYFSKLKGKPVWVTEWGILNQTMFHEKNLAVKAEKQILKTPGAAIAQIDWLMRMLDLKQITITSHHNLIDTQGFGLAQYTPNHKSVIRLPLYYVFKEAGEIFANYPDYFPMQISQTHRQDEKVLQKLDMKMFENFGLTPDVVSLPDVGVWGFGKGQKMKAALLINRTDKPQKVSLPRHRLARTWSYGGPNPLPGFMKAKVHWTSLPKVNPLPRTFKEAASKVITLEPFSMTIATVSK